MKKGFVYILTNKPKGVLYVGVTSDIENRIGIHSLNKNNSFVAKYKLYKLVHLEEFSSIEEAVRREKQIKNWHRNWKINLIETNNPKWDNLLLDSETSSK
ncbi:GIY-YIG nuclease family protein [candidate division Kazan bacterium]|uniref:GIY-YIG nuclease family protein n=1 Tax=candidate division Kazan bacterium TaxID=2202143 RepID=A0A420ZDK5_UNCK3|nr:MAG: GIY-YIG nuclease family protein [candidate division Kazan bacterium]